MQLPVLMMQAYARICRATACAYDASLFHMLANNIFECEPGCNLPWCSGHCAFIRVRARACAIAGTLVLRR